MAVGFVTVAVVAVAVMLKAAPLVGACGARGQVIITLEVAMLMAAAIVFVVGVLKDVAFVSDSGSCLRCLRFFVWFLIQMLTSFA